MFPSRSHKSKEAPSRRAQSRDARVQNDVDQQVFRRNRTLTGSSSSRVAAPSEQKADMKSPRVHSHILIRRRRHLGLMLMGALAACGVLVSLLWQFTATVQVQASPDVSLQLNASYQRAIQEYLGKQPIERLRFKLDQKRLTEYVQATAPEVYSVRATSTATPGTSLFQLVMRMPVAGWNINGKQRYVDGSGVSFERNYFSAPVVQIVDRSGVQVAAGQAIASNRFLGFVGRTVSVASTYGLSVEQIIIPSGTTREVDVKVAGSAYVVKFLIDRPVGEQVEDMARSIAWLKANNVTPEYVDVRVSGKAYYR